MKPLSFQKSFLTFLAALLLLALGCANQTQPPRGEELDVDGLASALLQLGEGTGQQTQAVSMETPVFRINDHTFTMQDVNVEAMRLLQASGRRWTQEELRQMAPSLQREAMRALTARHLAMQAAKDAGLQPATSQVLEELNKLEQGLPKDKSLTDLLKEQGITKGQLLERIRDDLRFRAYQKAILETVQPPTVEEVQEAYKANRDKFVAPEQCRIQHFFKAFTADMNEEEREDLVTRMDALRESLLEEGADFGAVVRRQSDGLNKELGGETIAVRGTQPPEFEALFFDLPVNGITDAIVDGTRGVHIIKVLEHIPERALAFNEVKEGLYQRLTRERQAIAIREDQLRLEKKATITQLWTPPDADTPDDVAPSDAEQADGPE